jgi:hypothetical protein
VTDMTILRLAGCQKLRPSSTASSARSVSLRRRDPKLSLLKQAMSTTEPQAAQQQEETEIPSQSPKRKRNTSLSGSSDSSGKSRSKPVSKKASLHFHSLLIPEVIFPS